MSGSGQFCPRCGSPVAGGGFSPPDRRGDAEARLCVECYLEAIELIDVPASIDVTICTQCGAVRDEGEWEELEDRDYTDVAIDAVADHLRIHRAAEDVAWTVEPQQRGPNELDIQLTVTARIEGVPVEEAATVGARIGRETCPRCGRMAGDYYAGTVQVRAAGREPTASETSHAVDIARRITGESDDRDAFISETVERDEGVDIRVSQNTLAQRIGRAITAELGGELGSSETLVTEDEEGEGVYRVAFAVRLPKFRSGDVIELECGRAVLVVGDVRGRVLADGEVVTLGDDAIESARRLGTLDDVTEATLVTVEDDHAIQVIDPDTAAAVTIPRPADLSVDRDTVPVMKTRLGLHAIPSAVIEAIRT